MATRRGRLVLIGVGVLLLVSLWRMVSLEQQKRQIDSAYQTAKQTLAALEQERAQLSSELGTAHTTIDEQSGHVTGLQTELHDLQGRLDQTLTELTTLQREHAQLRQEHTSLSTQFSSVMAEKQQLEAKLSSVKELKLAIRGVRRKIWSQRWTAWRARVQAQKAADQERLALGNRGYVIRQGVSTVGAQPKLQVHVLEPQAQ